MAELFELLTAANALSPLAIIGLLAVTVLLLVRGRKEVSEKMSTITDNHLHDLPRMADGIDKAVDVLQRIEVKMGTEFSHIRTKLDEK